MSILFATLRWGGEIRVGKKAAYLATWWNSTILIEA